MKTKEKGKGGNARARARARAACCVVALSIPRAKLTLERGAFDGMYFLRFVRSLDSGIFRGDAGGDEGFGFSRVLDARLGVLSQTTDDALKFAEKGALLFFVWGFDGG